MLNIAIYAAWQPYESKMTNFKKILEETILLVVGDHLLLINAINRQEFTGYMGFSLSFISCGHIFGSIGW